MQITWKVTQGADEGRKITKRHRSQCLCWKFSLFVYFCVCLSVSLSQSVWEGVCVCCCVYIFSVLYKFFHFSHLKWFHIYLINTICRQKVCFSVLVFIVCLFGFVFGFSSFYFAPFFHIPFSHFLIFSQFNDWSVICNVSSWINGDKYVIY